MNGGCCPLSANSASEGAHICKQGRGGRHSVPKGGGGGGGGGPGGPPPPPPPGDAHANDLCCTVGSLQKNVLTRTTSFPAG